MRTTVIEVKGNSRFELERLSERFLSHLMSWCGRYKLRLSTPKTKCMLIKSHMDRSRMPRVLCAGERALNAFDSTSILVLFWIVYLTL